MKKILLLIFIFTTLACTKENRRKHIDELLNQEQIRKVVKRFDDLQYDPANVIETVVPVQNHNNGYNFVTVKSNIPEEPSASQQYEDDQTNEIPVGPVVQTDETQQAEKGNVQLKDLLSFIRKTNIPEDPYATAERSQILSSPDYYSMELRSRNPLLSMDSINTRTLASQNDGIYQSKRFQFPQTARNQYPYPNRWSQNQMQYKMNGLVKKAEIPKAPTPFIKETYDAIFPNAEKGDKKSGIVNEDPYEELKKAITKKVQKASIPHEYNEKKSKLEMEDLYQTLKNSITKKAYLKSLNKTLVKKTSIPKPKYLMQYTELPLNGDNTDVETQEAAAFIQKMNQDYMKSGSVTEKKKSEIPGITIEHNLPRDSFPLTLRKIPMVVRKDMISETESNPQIIQDANNEKVYKKSEIPQKNINNFDESVNNGATSNIPDEATSDAAENPASIENDDVKEDSDEETASQKSNLPTAEELEAVKMDREMKLAEELKKLKKSSIPSLPIKENIQMVAASYPLQLRKYPAEGILRHEIPKRQNLLNYNMNKSMPSFQEIIKKFEIPQEPPLQQQSDMFTPITNNQDNQEYQKSQGSLPDINTLMQSNLMDRIQENEHREEQIQQQEQQQERRLWQQQKEDIANRMREEKNPDQDFVPYIGPNMDSARDNEKMNLMSQIESIRQFVQASQDQENNMNNMNNKRSEIPKPKNSEVLSSDSYPLVLRKWPPNRRRSTTE